MSSIKMKCFICDLNPTEKGLVCEQCRNYVVSIDTKMKLEDAVKQYPASLNEFKRQMKEHPRCMKLVGVEQSEQLIAENEHNIAKFGKFVNRMRDTINELHAKTIEETEKEKILLSRQKTRNLTDAENLFNLILERGDLNGKEKTERVKDEIKAEQEIDENE